MAPPPKLSPADIQNIIAEVKVGVKRIEVARKYGVHWAMITYYCGSGENIKRIKGGVERKLYYQNNKEKFKAYRAKYKARIKAEKIKAVRLKGKSYKELLAIENEKRKKMGLYELKRSSPWTSKKGL